jgi:hypothetical protein
MRRKLVAARRDLLQPQSQRVTMELVLPLGQRPGSGAEALSQSTELQVLMDGTGERKSSLSPSAKARIVL